MKEHRQQLENVMNAHHEESKQLALDHKQQLEDIKTSVIVTNVEDIDIKTTPGKMSEGVQGANKNDADYHTHIFQTEIISNLKEQQQDLRHIISD